MAQLRAKHSEGHHNYGLDMTNGKIEDMTKLGITESYRVKKQVLTAAAEAAEMIVRVDNIIKAAPRQRRGLPDH